MSVLKWIGGGIALGLGVKALFGRSTSSSSDVAVVSIPLVKDWGVPFASHTGRVWPVAGGSKAVPYTTPAGAVVGNSATMFHASREGGTRFHAGIDLQAAPGQRIVAMEDGMILGNIPGFVDLDAIVVQHVSGSIGVYAEVHAGGKILNVPVKAGQQIATGVLNKDGNSMLHLELWQPGHAPKSFIPWYSKNPAPAGLLDPTRYLLALAKS